MLRPIQDGTRIPCCLGHNAPGPRHSPRAARWSAAARGPYRPTAARCEPAPTPTPFRRPGPPTGHRPGGAGPGQHPAPPQSCRSEPAPPAGRPLPDPVRGPRAQRSPALAHVARNTGASPATGARTDPRTRQVPRGARGGLPAAFRHAGCTTALPGLPPGSPPRRSPPGGTPASPGRCTGAPRHPAAPPGPGPPVGTPPHGGAPLRPGRRSRPALPVSAGHPAKPGTWETGERARPPSHCAGPERPAPASCTATPAAARKTPLAARTAARGELGPGRQPSPRPRGSAPGLRHVAVRALRTPGQPPGRDSSGPLARPGSRLKGRTGARVIAPGGAASPPASRCGAPRCGLAARPPTPHPAGWASPRGAAAPPSAAVAAPCAAVGWPEPTWPSRIRT